MRRPLLGGGGGWLWLSYLRAHYSSLSQSGFPSGWPRSSPSNSIPLGLPNRLTETLLSHNRPLIRLDLSLAAMARSLLWKTGPRSPILTNSVVSVSFCAWTFNLLLSVADCYDCHIFFPRFVIGVSDPNNPTDDSARPNSWTPPLNQSWDFNTGKIYG